MPRKPKNQPDDINSIVSEKEIKNNSKKTSNETNMSSTLAQKGKSKKVDASASSQLSKNTSKKNSLKSETSISTNMKKTKSTVKKYTDKVKASSSKKSTAKSKNSKLASKSSKKSSSIDVKTNKKNANKSIKPLKPNKTEEITSSTDLTKKVEILEFYDLPYRYNQTIVKVLAQTPTTLFIYWDISDTDRNNYIKQYGENFFNNTKPVLIIHNHTMNYSFEIEIDDFANSWYLHVNDSNCEYTVELGRKPKYYSEEYVNIPNNYLCVTSSNIIDAPNDHILFDKNLKTVYFRDVKTNIVTSKDITSVSFLRNMGKVYNLYDLQSDFNKDSCINNDFCKLGLNNPSSGSSSTFK